MLQKRRSWPRVAFVIVFCSILDWSIYSINSFLQIIVLYDGGRCLNSWCRSHFIVWRALGRVFCGQERLVSPNLASYTVGILLCAIIENIFDSDCAIDNWYNTAVETARSCFFSVFGVFFFRSFLIYLFVFLLHQLSICACSVRKENISKQNLFVIFVTANQYHNFSVLLKPPH